MQLVTDLHRRDLEMINVFIAYFSPPVACKPSLRLCRNMFEFKSASELTARAGSVHFYHKQRYQAGKLP